MMMTTSSATNKCVTVILWTLVSFNLLTLVVGGLVTWLGYTIPIRLKQSGLSPELVISCGFASLLVASLGLCALNYSSHYALNIYGLTCTLFVLLLISGILDSPPLEQNPPIARENKTSLEAMTSHERQSHINHLAAARNDTTNKQPALEAVTNRSSISPQTNSFDSFPFSSARVKSSKFAPGGLLLHAIQFVLITVLLILLSFAFALAHQFRRKQEQEDLYADDANDEQQQLQFDNIRFPPLAICGSSQDPCSCNQEEWNNHDDVHAGQHSFNMDGEEVVEEDEREDTTASQLVQLMSPPTTERQKFLDDHADQDDDYDYGNQLSATSRRQEGRQQSKNHHDHRGTQAERFSDDNQLHSRATKPYYGAQDVECGCCRRQQRSIETTTRKQCRRHKRSELCRHRRHQHRRCITGQSAAQHHQQRRPSIGQQVSLGGANQARENHHYNNIQNEFLAATGKYIDCGLYHRHNSELNGSNNNGGSPMSLGRAQKKPELNCEAHDDHLSSMSAESAEDLLDSCECIDSADNAANYDDQYDDPLVLSSSVAGKVPTGFDVHLNACNQHETFKTAAQPLNSARTKCECRSEKQSVEENDQPATSFIGNSYSSQATQLPANCCCSQTTLQRQQQQQRPACRQSVLTQVQPTKTRASNFKSTYAICNQNRSQCYKSNKVKSRTVSSVIAVTAATAAAAFLGGGVGITDDMGGGYSNSDGLEQTAGDLNHHSLDANHTQ